MASEQTTIAKFFEILEITPDEQLKLSTLTKDEQKKLITKCYKKLAILYHPDKNLDSKDTAKEKFQIILNARNDLISHIESESNFSSQQIKARSSSKGKKEAKAYPTPSSPQSNIVQLSLIIKGKFNEAKNQLLHEFSNKKNELITEPYNKFIEKEREHYLVYLQERYKLYCTSFDSQNNEIEEKYKTANASIRLRRNVSFGLSFLIIPLFLGIFYHSKLTELEKEKQAEFAALPKPTPFDEWEKKNKTGLRSDWKKTTNKTNFIKVVIKFSSNAENPKPDYLKEAIDKIGSKITALNDNFEAINKYNESLCERATESVKGVNVIGRDKAEKMVVDLFIKTLDDPRSRDIEKKLSAFKEKIKTENQPQTKTKAEAEVNQTIERPKVTLR